MQKVIIYTDGACSGNPGPGGWGVLLECGSKTKKVNGFELDTTNNRMELLAAIRGLELLTRPSSVDLYTDSKYVQQGITNWIQGWKAKNWKTSSGSKVKNIDLWQKLDQLALVHNVNWCWVKGHAGIAGNEVADTLARQAVIDKSGNYE